jgi:hypothetical protein
MFVDDAPSGLQNIEEDDGVGELVGTLISNPGALGPTPALVGGGVRCFTFGDAMVRSFGTCRRSATFLACPVDKLLITSGFKSAHIWSALIDPHSMILLFSQTRETGFVRKSLQPAASAATRSLCRDEAVKATIITDERYGDEVDLVSVDVSEGVRGGASDDGVIGGYPAAAFDCSRRRISFVAWMPFMTGIWMSICRYL